MANMKSDASNATAADRAQKLVARPATPTKAELAERAHEDYVTRGGEDGHDVGVSATEPSRTFALVSQGQ